MYHIRRSWVPDAKYKSAYSLVHLLIDIVCKGGNLLLNIAPGPDGSWDEKAYERLNAIGDWMKINGEAIYGTRPIAPYKEAKICYTNKKNSNTVYAIYLPDENEEKIPSEIMIYSFKPKTGTGVTLLGYSQQLNWEEVGNGTLIYVPVDIQNNPKNKYAWAFKINEIEK